MRELKCMCYSLVLLVLVLNLLRISGEINNGSSPDDKVIFCYFATYAEHRPGRGNFKLENFDPTLCTHLVYAFVLLNQANNSLFLLSPLPDLHINQSDGENNISRLKKAYPHLKVTFSIGGWLDGSIKYSEMAANVIKRQGFVNNTLDFIKKYHFDGADITWEYPAKRGGSRSDKRNFVKLIKELRQAFDQHNYIITAALDSSKDTIDYGYDIAELSKYLHYMIVMCYDFNGKWSRFIGHNAPIHDHNILNTAYTIDYLLKLGANSNKILMGLPLYGRTFIMADQADFTKQLPGLGQRFKNYSFEGPFTQEEGFIGYNEICLEFRNSSLWKFFWDDFSQVPFAINGEKFISYDNIKSIEEKIKYAIKNKLGGIMVWSIDTDDFRGDCQQKVDGHENYPLMRTINIKLEEYLKRDKYYNYENDIIAKPILENSSNKFSLNLLLLFSPVYFTNWCNKLNIN